MSGIPDPGGVSGTFAALERTTPVRPAVTMFAYPAGQCHVRVIRDQDGEPLFVLADLCRALAIRNGRDVAARLADDQKGVGSIDTPGGAQQMTVVTESGMYEVVIRSDKPEAVAFRRWITGEVLPEIRRTGTYSRYPAAPQQLPSKKELAQWVVEAEERAELAEAKVAELEPSAVAWDRLAEVGADYEVGDAAKILSRDPKISIGRNRLFEFMRERGWIYRGRHNAWKAYQDQVDNGRLKQRPGREYFCKRHNEYRTGDPTIVITPKGLAELRRLLGGSGQLELVAAS